MQLQENCWNLVLWTSLWKNVWHLFQGSLIDTTFFPFGLSWSPKADQHVNNRNNTSAREYIPDLTVIEWYRLNAIFEIDWSVLKGHISPFWASLTNENTFRSYWCVKSWEVTWFNFWRYELKVLFECCTRNFHHNNVNILKFLVNHLLHCLLRNVRKSKLFNSPKSDVSKETNISFPDAVSFNHEIRIFTFA